MRLTEPFSIWKIQDKLHLGIMGFIRGIHWT